MTKNHKIKKDIYSDGIPIKGYVAFYVISRFRARNKKKSCWKIK